MTLTNATLIELGLLIHSLAEFSCDPRLGAHIRQGAGEVSAYWDVQIRPFGSWKPVTVGSINLSFDGFEIEDATSDNVLSSAAEVFSDAMKNLSKPDSQIDFKRFSKIG